jgi:hypothetical protein
MGCTRYGPPSRCLQLERGRQSSRAAYGRRPPGGPARGGPTRRTGGHRTYRAGLSRPAHRRRAVAAAGSGGPAHRRAHTSPVGYPRRPFELDVAVTRICGEHRPATQAVLERAIVAAEQSVARRSSDVRRYGKGPPVTRLDVPGLQLVSIGRTRPQPSDHGVVVLDVARCPAGWSGSATCPIAGTLPCPRPGSTPATPRAGRAPRAAGTRSAGRKPTSANSGERVGEVRRCPKPLGRDDVSTCVDGSFDGDDEAVLHGRDPVSVGQ